MSTNKRTKKPFWREKWEGGQVGGGQAKKKKPLKKQREIKRRGGKRKQEGKQTELKNQSDSTTDNERII